MYKLSKYNYFVEHENKLIYFNGMSGTSFAMSMHEHQKISPLLENLSTFENEYKSIFERFVKWGFIVPVDLDEIDLLRFNNKTAVFTAHA